RQRARRRTREGVARRGGGARARPMRSLGLPYEPIVVLHALRGRRRAPALPNLTAEAPFKALRAVVCGMCGISAAIVAPHLDRAASDLGRNGWNAQATPRGSSLVPRDDAYIAARFFI